MSLRERIADWISGGEISALIADMNSLRAALNDEVAQNQRLKEINKLLLDDSHIDWSRSDLMFEALNRIAALETPKSSHTVRKMAGIAREAAQ